MKQLQLSALKADLAAVNAMLQSRSREADPVGWRQFSKRRDNIQAQLDEMDAREETQASVALFFGGRPVLGSHGINAAFAGKVLDTYQDLISKRSAAAEQTELNNRGPVPGKANSQLMVTQVARGSFGFVLEEHSETPSLLSTPLRAVVEDVCDTLQALAEQSETGLENTADALDDRLLISLREFFKLLDDSGATMRIVEGARQIVFGKGEIERARARAESLEVVESEELIQGSLFLLPESLRFEFQPADGSTVRRGVASRNAIKAILDEAGNVRQDAIGKRFEARFIKKEIRRRNEDAKTRHQLIELREIASQP